MVSENYLGDELNEEYPIRTRLNMTIEDAGLNDEITDEWCSGDEAQGFREFLSQMPNIADMKSDNKNVWLPAKTQLANIIIAMDKNPSIRNKINYTDKSLATLYDNQKKLSAFEYVAKTITTGKVEALRTRLLNPILDPDRTEVGLAYLKGLKTELGIEISDMLYEGISHVTNGDIAEAKLMLSEYSSNEDNIYAEMAKSDIIKLKFANEFRAIENKDEYDTTKDGADYNVIGANIMRYKISCIKLALQVELASAALLEKLKLVVNNFSETHVSSPKVRVALLNLATN